MKVSEQCRIAASKGNQVRGMIRRNITYKDKRGRYHTIYTTKIDGVVCPPNISEPVTGSRLMKLAHRQSIASTTIKLISEKKITVHFINFSKNNLANRR